MKIKLYYNCNTVFQLTKHIENKFFNIYIYKLGIWEFWDLWLSEILREDAKNNCKGFTFAIFLHLGVSLLPERFQKYHQNECSSSESLDLSILLRFFIFSLRYHEIQWNSLEKVVFSWVAVKDQWLWKIYIALWIKWFFVFGKLLMW